MASGWQEIKAGRLVVYRTKAFNVTCRVVRVHPNGRVSIRGKRRGYGPYWATVKAENLTVVWEGAEPPPGFGQ